MFNQISIAGRLRDSLFRHRWIFLISLFLVSGITTGAVLLRPKTFHASASTQVVTDSQQVAEALGEKYRYLYVSSAQQHVNHFNDLTSDDLPGGFWDTALKDANLSRTISIDPRIKDPRFARLRKQLSATADSSTMFTIGLTWENADECERIVEALQKEYSREIGQEQEIKSISTRTFLKKEINDLVVRLQTAEKAVSDYKSNHGGLVESAQKAEIDNLALLKAKRDDLLIATQNGGMKTQMMEMQLAQTPPKIIFDQTFTDSPAVKTLNFLQNKRVQLLADGNALTSNRIRDVDQQISDVKKQINQDAAARLANPNASPLGGNNTSVLQTRVQENPTYNALRRQVLNARADQASSLQALKNTQARIAEYEKRIAALPAQEARLASLVRDYDLLKGQYAEYQQRLEQARTKAQLDSVTLADTLIRVGTIFATPTQGQAKTLLMVVGSLILGLIISTGVVVFAEWNDPTLRYPADVERFLDLPVLASVPEIAAIDTSKANDNNPPAALPGGSGVTPDGIRFGRNPAGLAARNPSMGTYGPQ